MKLELRKNFDSVLDEMKGKVSKTKPVMGILIGPCPKWGTAVKCTVVGKNIKELISLMKIDETKITEFADLR